MQLCQTRQLHESSSVTFDPTEGKVRGNKSTLWLLGSERKMLSSRAQLVNE